MYLVSKLSQVGASDWAMSHCLLFMVYATFKSHNVYVRVTRSSASVMSYTFLLKNLSEAIFRQGIWSAAVCWSNGFLSFRRTVQWVSASQNASRHFISPWQDLHKKSRGPFCGITSFHLTIWLRHLHTSKNFKSFFGECVGMLFMFYRITLSSTYTHSSPYTTHPRRDE